MKVPSISPAVDAAILLALLSAPLPVAGMFSCDNIVVDKQKYHLKELGGPHSVVTTRVVGDIAHNTTYTVDICQNLKKKGDVKNHEQCKNGSRVCAIKRLIGLGDSKTDMFEKAIPIAGDLQNHGGGPLDDEKYRIGTSDAEDTKDDGIRVVFNGGFDDTDSGVIRKQKAVISFLCDPDRNGTENEYDPEDDKYERRGFIPANPTNPLSYRAEDGEEDDDDDDQPTKEEQLGIERDPSLVFKGYGPSEENPDIDVLHLTWKSKYVCKHTADDGSDGEGEGEASSHWGFFTWLVILVFLGTAAYLIFGSWLNYNRYGARGWDLLPHGDTIRDVPYLLKDWTRRVLNTVQGSGSRGGYSAV
ncbi:autophagy-related protein 27 [Xylariomycetidae sp. FL2044]|nr:autophagy-related protein 27 [Xylariomycetidae sp. FL2044]